MHQIRFRLGLRPQTPLGELTALPRPPTWISGVLLLRGGKGEKGEKGEGRERKGKERGRKEGKGGEEGERGKERKGKRRQGIEGEDPLDLLPPEKFPSYATES